MKTLSLFLFLTLGPSLRADESPRIFLSTAIVPLEEDVSLFVSLEKNDQSSESMELRLTTLTGSGEAFFAEDKVRFGDQTFLTFLVDAKTGEVTDVLGGSMKLGPRERLE
ncbi:MAG: hypothetical protein JJT75_14785 [Opitutales bacterium]|nr:hypothetical protein [Opitutales bacterium]MCH8541771.1 hypothetical protein [Opitutales bacterium]